MKTRFQVFFVLCALFAAIGLGFAPASFGAKTGTTTQEIAAKIDINTADAPTLITLPGIGEKTAAAIIDYRKTQGNFKSVDDLIEVKGIGEKKLAKIRPYLQTI